MLVPCEGGPSLSRLVTYPPPLEIEVGTSGMYVLEERRSPTRPDCDYVYVYVPERM